jgi:hypothetical protein
VSSNLKEFELGLDEFENETDRQVEKLHRAVALEALKGVVLMSPVDTGRFRANWQVTPGTPATTELDQVDKPGGRTIAAGSAEIAKAQAYSVTWITNNVPYAEELENGSSQQAPQGMLNVTYNRLVAWLARKR